MNMGLYLCMPRGIYRYCVLQIHIWNMVKEVSLCTSLNLRKQLPPSNLCGERSFARHQIQRNQCPKRRKCSDSDIYNPDLWGPDALLFKPDRFSNGITGACKIPQAYMPFGVVARTCLGQNFTIMELKVILSLVLAKFSFSLAATYRHSPVFRLVILPEFGVSITVEKL